MAYGLQIQGSHGVVQIDQDYKNLQLIAKGTHSWGAFAAGATSLNLATVSSPLLAISTSTAVLVSSDNVVPNTTYNFLSASAGSCTYYLFDAANTDNGETWGLAVHNAAGALTYHSAWKILRIGAVGNSATGSLVGPSGTVTSTLGAPYAATWAAVASSVRHRNFMVSGSQHALAWDALKCDNSGASIETHIQQPISGIYVSDQPNGGNILLIDVSGY